MTCVHNVVKVRLVTKLKFKKSNVYKPCLFLFLALC